MWRLRALRSASKLGSWEGNTVRVKGDPEGARMLFCFAKLPSFDGPRPGCITLQLTSRLGCSFVAGSLSLEEAWIIGFESILEVLDIGGR